MRPPRILVATGLRDELPDVPGLGDRWARDVLHCPYCHGWEVRDQQLGVLWNGPDTVRYTQIIRQWADDVVLFAPADTLTHADRSQLVARAIGIVEAGVTGVVVEDDHLRGVQLDDGRTIGRDALFVPPRFVPNNDLLTRLGCDLDQNGWVVTGPAGTTSIARGVGGRKRHQRARPSHHRRRRRIRRGHRHQRRPRRRGRTQRRPRLQPGLPALAP